MQASRINLLIKKVYENGFTWQDLENYFSLNRKFLKKEINDYFDKSGEGISMVINRIDLNDRNKSLSEYEFER